MAITAGDIAIIGLITNGNPTDSFSILTLAPIAAGEVIYFTDNGWTGTGFRGVSTTDTDGNENLIKFTVNTAIAAGTVISTSSSDASYTWTTSSVVKTGVTGSFLPLALAQGGDQITAVQSTSADPLLNNVTPIFQVDNTGTFENAIDSGSGSIAPGLAASTTAVLLNNLATTAKFKLDTLTTGTKEQWLAAINNPANWTFDSSATLPSNGVTVGGNTPINPNPPPNPTIPNSEVPTTITKISSIQGSGATFNTAFGGIQTIEGIVVGAFQGSTKLNGFYVQEENADSDGNAATSEGIFVFDPTGQFTGSVGNKVRVTGTVGEFTSNSGGVNSSLTQLASITSVVNLGASTLPTVTTVSLPTTSLSGLESYEGMLVNISGADSNLTVTNNFTLGRFGQVGLSTGGRVTQYTQINAPSVSGNSAYQADVAARQIILDDGSSTQNPDPEIFARNGQPLSAANTLRTGDTVASLSGILDQRFEGFRVQTTTPVNFLPTNARTPIAPLVGGNLKVASFNLLNLFNGNGIDANNDNLIDGGFPTARGANTAIEFNRQIDKTVTAILNLNADILSYSELENDGFGANSAAQKLVNALNAKAGTGTYNFIQPPATALDVAGRFGGDEIAVGFIYKTSSARVAPGTTVAALTTGVFDQVTTRVQRPPLAVTFERLANGTPTNETFTAVANHFKSKGSSADGVGDADALDGQGLSNGTRTRAAQQLSAWLATNPTGTTDADYLILGDLNSYRLEDPITALTNAGYNNLLSPTDYSFQFNGQFGSLDYALASNSLRSQVTGAADWHINADEPIVLDYNTEFKTPGQVNSFYNADPFRSSDHDPIVVGLNLKSNNPFPNGIASGDTTQNSTVLWTRATTLGNVTFEYSTTADFSSIAGTKIAVVTNAAQPVKVNVDGLTANTNYFYRVTDANNTKIAGKFSTAAALGTKTGLKFGASGDWRGELAPYPAIANADEANLKFFVELGDTIYGDVASPAVKNPDGTEKEQSTTLSDYRAKQSEVYSSRFGQNTFGDLRAATSILTTIDDHEVTDDFAGGQNLATSSAADKALYGASSGLINDSPLFENGLQAFQEFNPIRDLTYNTPGDARTDGERQLYRTNTFGSDAATFILDARSFRDTELPGVSNLADQAQVGKFLTDSFNPQRTLLGRQQIEDLKRDLLQSQKDGVTWKFITVPEPIQNIGVLAASDRFEGYAAERTEILKFINDNKIANVVFISADIHGTLVNNLTYQTAPGQAQIATSAFEITTGSVGYSKPFGPTVAELGAALGVITPTQKALYDSLPTAGKDAFIKNVVDGGLQPLGYDPLGLDKNLAQANGLINAKLLQGDYVATHVYGWSEFNIDQQTQKLTVTTYGIEPYTRSELEANPAAITSRQPKIVSQFEVTPTAIVPPTTASAASLVAGTTGADQLIAGLTPAFDGINDLVFAGAGNDNIDIAIAGELAKNNRVDAGSGADVIFVANADRAFGSTGDDEFEASEARDYRIAGGNGNDTFFLGSNGRAVGGDGNDRLFVGSGGGNLLTGGAGADQFWIANAELPSAANTILDFQLGRDVVGIQGAKSLGISATTLVLSQVGEDTSIGFGGQTLALLKGIQANSLSTSNASQFVFA
jgi:predicted extracellular nuclease/phosphodiesterase/alkaline phosphatase D-like protein